LNIRQDKLLIVDLEATCWENRVIPPNQTQEVIEIGICALNLKTHDIADKQSLLIRPILSTISPFCTRLTGITAEMIAKDGIAFSEACERLVKDYDAPNTIWASWGSFDHNLMTRQCKRTRIPFPFHKKYINLKRLFQQTYGRRLPMNEALSALGLTLEGAHHRGADDAYNIARLLVALLEAHGRGILRPYGVEST
jgi:inhibitor of KinA sporulation pathway (predicted exonuclease)